MSFSDDIKKWSEVKLRLATALARGRDERYHDLVNEAMRRVELKRRKKESK